MCVCVERPAIWVQMIACSPGCKVVVRKLMMMWRELSDLGEQLVAPKT
jgi:hypothetical protein